MKVGILSLLGVAIFLAFSIAIQVYISKSTAHLDQKFQTIESELNSQKWTQANRSLKTAKKNWNHIKPVWSLFLHHQEIDAIDEALVRTDKAVQTKNESASRIEMGTLRQYLKHIPERERFNLVNIL